MVTVGISALNEEKSIAKCLKIILKQLSKKDEIIVVSDGSTDRTAEEILNVYKKDKRVVPIINKERNGKAKAFNLIKKKAKSDILIQTDADVFLEEGSIKKLLKHFSDSKIGGVSGNPIPVIPKDNVFYDWTIMSYRRSGELRKKESEQGIFWHMSGYLCAYRNDLISELPQVKGAVDAWMGKIIKDKGYVLAYEPEAKVFVKAPLNISDFIKQKARVRAGYYFLKKQAGKAPRTITKEIFWFPRELLKVPVYRWHKFFFSGFVYLYSWIKGGYMAKTNKSLHQIWQTPTSTK